MSNVDTSPAAQAGQAAGQKLRKVLDGANKKAEGHVYTSEEIKNVKTCQLSNGSEVLFFSFGRNYGPSIQPGYRSVTDKECIEMFKDRKGKDLYYSLSADVFIVCPEKDYYVYNSKRKSFLRFNPRNSLSDLFKSQNPMLQSDLPFWHHYICYLPQIKLGEKND